MNDVIVVVMHEFVHTFCESKYMCLFFYLRYRIVHIDNPAWVFLFYIILFASIWIISLISFWVQRCIAYCVLNVNWLQNCGCSSMQSKTDRSQSMLYFIYNQWRQQIFRFWFVHWSLFFLFDRGFSYWSGIWTHIENHLHCDRYLNVINDH